jgi:hypothetical protein
MPAYGFAPNGGTLEVALSPRLGQAKKDRIS